MCVFFSLQYIISGSLSVAAENNQSRCLVRGSLAMNIISSVVSAIAIIVFCVDIPVSSFYYCDSSLYACYMLKNVYVTAITFLIIASVLQFCVSVSLSIFGCRSLTDQSVTRPQMFVMQNDQWNPLVQSDLPPNENPSDVSVLLKTNTSIL
ncbi:membrane-spanning 4-domains subfamily A member 4A-like [Ascaphus truei]|uniref:membrane-spanning 4-domains subfamily A member 4A-like n=1 Tax=Ascaphus truei TaxID=8439 RepID=UPI003F59FD70